MNIGRAEYECNVMFMKYSGEFLEERKEKSSHEIVLFFSSVSVSALLCMAYNLISPFPVPLSFCPACASVSVSASLSRRIFSWWRGAWTYRRVMGSGLWSLIFGFWLGALV